MALTITTGEIFSACRSSSPRPTSSQAIFERIQAGGFDIIDEVIDDIRREDERRALGDEPAERPVVAQPLAPVAPPAPLTAARAAPPAPGAA